MPKPSKKGPNRFYLAIKRGFDIFSSILLLLILMPLLIIISIVIIISDGCPIVFSQERMGRGPKLFNCYKFRTMRNDAPHYMGKSDLNDPDKYITGFGRFLRRSSLDELPQLFNILVGDMSMVGPRPIIAKELNLQRLRTEAGIYSIRPGLTGYAQVSGRNDLDDETKVEYDTYYLKHMSAAFDLWILFKTVRVVIKRDGEHEGASASALPPEVHNDNLKSWQAQKPSRSVAASADKCETTDSAGVALCVRETPAVSETDPDVSASSVGSSTETQ